MKFDKKSSFLVRGSYGTIIADAKTGVVIDYKPDNKKEREYDDIARFDLDEWQKEYPDQTIAGTENDVCDLALWNKAGVHEPAAFGWRKGDDAPPNNERDDFVAPTGPSL